MLEALVASCGGRVVSSSRAPDDEAAITSAAAAALAGADLLITCGGMSVGPHDHVRTALAAAGVEPVFAGVALAPGRPAGFGMGPGGRPVFGLPGNPLSALVAFRLLVEPALDRLAARDEDDRRTVTVKASHGFPGRDGVTTAVPCRIDAQGAAPMPVTGHGPTAALGADGLALVAPGRAGAAQGEAVTVALLHTPSPWVVSMACVCS
jgi:molybdopterin molybdotransferase